MSDNIIKHVFIYLIKKNLPPWTCLIPSDCQPSAFFQSDLSKEMDLKLGFDEQKHRNKQREGFPGRRRAWAKALGQEWGLSIQGTFCKPAFTVKDTHIIMGLVILLQFWEKK